MKRTLATIAMIVGVASISLGQANDSQQSTNLISIKADSSRTEYKEGALVMVYEGKVEARVGAGARTVTLQADKMTVSADPKEPRLYTFAAEGNVTATRQGLFVIKDGVKIKLPDDVTESPRLSLVWREPEPEADN